MSWKHSLQPCNFLLRNPSLWLFPSIWLLLGEDTCTISMAHHSPTFTCTVTWRMSCVGWVGWCMWHTSIWLCHLLNVLAIWKQFIRDEDVWLNCTLWSQSVWFTHIPYTYNIPFDFVCGKVVCYSHHSQGASYYSTLSGHTGIDDAYLSGLSITYWKQRQHTHQHIWSYAAGYYESDSNPYNCPCAANPGQAAPSFICNDYYCESGPHTSVPNQWHMHHQLTVGWQRMYHGSNCCNSTHMPWFWRLCLRKLYPTLKFAFVSQVVMQLPLSSWNSMYTDTLTALPAALTLASAVSQRHVVVAVKEKCYRCSVFSMIEWIISLVWRMCTNLHVAMHTV